MELDNWENAVALIATFLFLIQMLTPIKTFVRVAHIKSTEDLSVAPYNTAFLSCALWMLYGILIHDPYVIFTNAYGTILQFLFVLCFWLYSPARASTLKHLSCSVLILVISVYYCYYETNYPLLLERIALLCALITFAFYVAPFANLGHVLRTRNADSLPVTLISFTFLVSLLWMAYGVIIHDLALKITNFVGVVLSAMQLFLILKFSYLSPGKKEPLLP